MDRFKTYCLAVQNQQRELPVFDVTDEELMAVDVNNDCNSDVYCFVDVIIVLILIINYQQ